MGTKYQVVSPNGLKLVEFESVTEAMCFRDGYNVAQFVGEGNTGATIEVIHAVVCPACGEFSDFNKIPVIAHVRNEHGFKGLKNAKEFVEEWKRR